MSAFFLKHFLSLQELARGISAIAFSCIISCISEGLQLNPLATLFLNF